MTCQTPHMKYCRKGDDAFYYMVMTNTNTKTETKTKTQTKTKSKEDPTYAIFSKSREFRDIKYDQTRPGQTRPEKRRIQSRGPNSRTCVLAIMIIKYFEP